MPLGLAFTLQALIVLLLSLLTLIPMPDYPTRHPVRIVLTVVLVAGLVASAVLFSFAAWASVE